MTSMTEYLSLVYYFSEHPQHIGAIFAQCCQLSAKLLGAGRAEIDCGLGKPFEERKRPKGPRKFVSLQQENLEAMIDQHASGTAAICIAAPRTANLSGNDFLWTLVYKPDPVSAVPFEPYLGIHFGLTFMAREQVDALAALTERVSEYIVENTVLCHGLCDVGDVRMTGRGLLYDSIHPPCVALDRRIRRQVWLALGERRQRTLRGVFWGQLLSRWMTERVGGAERFVREYQELEDPVNRNLVRVFPDGSMWVRLSNSPEEMQCPSVRVTPPIVGAGPTTIARAVWLHQRFGAAGIL